VGAPPALSGNNGKKKIGLDREIQANRQNCARQVQAIPIATSSITSFGRTDTNERVRQVRSGVAAPKRHGAWQTAITEIVPNAR